MVGTKRRTSSIDKRRIKIRKKVIKRTKKIQKRVRKGLKKAFPIAALGIELAPKPITDL